MKVNVDYEMVLDAIDKLSSGETLSSNEAQEVVKVLKAVQGDYIPTREEMQFQSDTLRRLDNIDSNRHLEAFNRLIDLCTEYENKYC